MPIDTWPDEHANAFRDLHASGLSQSQCAAALNERFETTRYTRNACIGKASRMGLVPPKGTPARTERQERADNRKRETAKLQRHIEHPQSALIDWPPAPVRAPIDLPGAEHPEGLIDLIDLQPHHCRFPFGQGPFHFCGAEKVDRFPYCAEHVRVTHPPEVLKR